VKRSDALVRLSRDHHQGLVVAQRLRRATVETAAAARTAFLEYWTTDGHEHFKAEEELLLPAFARYEPPTNHAVVRVLTDHVDLRRRAADVAIDDAPTCDDLQALGVRLRDHIRHEERVLFPLIEAALPADELVVLAAALERWPD
jgi:hypothetical protein